MEGRISAHSLVYDFPNCCNQHFFHPDTHLLCIKRGGCNSSHNYLQVEHTNKTFEIMKDKPLRNKFEPPVAAAVTWTQFILRRLRNTITSFLKVPEICEAEHMKTVSQLGVCVCV